MDHPFTPPSRIPSLPTPTKEKKKAETYFTIPQTSSAHLTDAELQQLTRSSLELTRPVFSRSHSRESRSGSRSSGYDRLYGRDGRSGSVSAIAVHTSSSAGLSGLELMQASYSSAALQHPQPYPKASQYLTGHLPPDSCAVSSNASLNSASPNGGLKGGLQGSMDGPSAPAPTSNPVGAQHLTGSDLHLPPDEIPASVGHLIGVANLDLPAGRRLTGADLHLPPDQIPASVSHLIGADLKLPDGDAPAIQSPYPVQPHTVDELEKSASVAELLLERMDTPSLAHRNFLPLDDSLAPTPPALPTRKESVEVVYQSFEIVTNTTVTYEAPAPPSVVALISNLGTQGDASSDPNWPLPARTPVYTFIPPPPSASPIASSLDASIPSNIPSPAGSPITASQQQPVQSFIPPPRTLPTVVFELSATQQPAAYSMIPPPHDIATSVAPYNQPFSATPNSMAPFNQDQQPGFSTAETAMDPNNQPFVMPASHYQESAVAAPTPTSIAPYSQPMPSSALQNPLLSDMEEAEAVTAARAAYVHPAGSRTSSSALYNQPHIRESSPMPRAVASFNQPSVMPSSMASKYRESDAVAAAREAYDEPAQQFDVRVQMPGRFPTGDSVRTIVNSPSTSNYQSGNSHNEVQYPTPHYQADPEAVAAARAAYVHPSRSRTSSTALYNQPCQSASHAAMMSVAGYNQPSAMPSHMASHYRESSAVAAAKEAFDQPAGSMRSQMSQMHDQPAAMPSSMASHYRESSAVAKARGAYDEPSHADVMRMSSNQSPSGLTGAITGFNNAFNRQNWAQKPVELSDFQNTQVQSPITRVPVPVHGSTPGTERNTLTKPPPVVVQDAALAPKPVFRHSSQLKHDPNFRGNGTPNPQPPTQRLGLVPDQGLYHGQYQGQPQQYAGQQHLGQAPPIDRQLPALAPSLHIETVPSFPRGPPKEASFWRRRKKALIIMLVCVLLGIGVGIVFVAQSFYKRWGGVGFLGAPVDITKRDAVVANRGHIGRRGFEHQKNAGWYMDDNKAGYLQAANGDILAHQKAGEGRKAGKGLLEGMLMAGYKRGWGTDFKNDDAESSPIIPVKRVKHVTVIPVGSAPFTSDFDVGPTWWNARMNDMQKRGEEIIAAHPSPEDALEHAAALAQRFVDEIKARIEGSVRTCASTGKNGPSCPQCCRSDSSDVDMAMALASDYVDRVPVDSANDYDLDLLMESMNTSDMKRPAQEVAMLAAQGYTKRVPEDVIEVIEAQSLSMRGVFSAEDVERLMAGEDVPESVTITVTKTRISTGAPTGLTPQEQATHFASGYAEAIPHEDDGGYVRSKRSLKVIAWEALAARNAHPDVMPWADLQDAGRAQIASACAGIYGRAPAEELSELTKRAKTLKQVARHLVGKRDVEPEVDVKPWAALGDAEKAEIASACAGIHSKAGQALEDLEDGSGEVAHEKRSWSPYEVAMQMAGEYAKHVPDHAPATPPNPSPPSTPVSKRLPNGVPMEPAELIAAAFLSALKHDDNIAPSESAKRSTELYTRTTPKQGEVAGRSWSPYEVAKQMAGEYAKAIPVKKSLSKRHHGDGQANEKRAWTPYEVAQQMAGEYAKAVPDHGPASVKEEVEEASEKEKRAWAPFEVAQQMASEYAKAVPVKGSLVKRAIHGDLKEPTELLAAAFLGGLKSEEDAGRWTDDGELAKRKNVPFVTCGDHRKGCEAHAHPEICCAVLHTCHKSPTTNSGIICCPGTVDCSGSHTEVLTQAFCPPSTVPCPVEASGGCCPTLDQCSPNGCLEFAPGLAPSDGPAKAHTETRGLVSTTTVVWGMNGEVLVPESTTITVTEQVGGKVSVTATVAKDGELASGKSSLSAEETYSDGTVIKSGSFKSESAAMWMGTRWWGGRRAMVWRLVGVAALMSLL